MGRPSLVRTAAALSAAALLGGAASGAPAAFPPAAPAETGTIFSVAGGGFFTHGEVTERLPIREGDPAGLAPLDSPGAVFATPDGGFLVTDTYGNRIRRVSARGTIRTVAGTGRGGLTGDGGPATAARLDHPSGAALLADGAVAIADQRNNRVRLVDAAGTISTLAPARWPDGVAAAPGGGVLVVEALNNRILHVSRGGVVTVLAGDGTRGYAGDGGPATAARLSRPAGVAVAGDGAVLIADGSSHVRRVAPDGTISTVATIPRPTAVAATPEGAILVTSVNRVLRVRPDGTVVAVAGTGRGNFAGDAGPALKANLWRPSGVAAAAGGGILVADFGSNRVRFVAGALPGAAGSPPAPRLLGASFRRPIQRGNAGIVTRLRVACPPRLVAVRYAVSRTADVAIRVTGPGARLTLTRSRVRPGLRVARFTVRAPGFHRLRLTARSGTAIAVDQAQLDVAPCRRLRAGVLG